MKLLGYKGQAALDEGRGLLWAELEGYREDRKPLESAEKEEITEGMQLFLEDLKGKYKGKRFTSSQVREELELSLGQSTLIKYFHVLRAKKCLKIVSGSRYSGFLYELED